MAVTVKPTSISPSTSSYTGGSYTPYGMVSPAQGMDLLHQSIAYNTQQWNQGMGGYGVGGGGGGGGSSAYFSTPRTGPYSPMGMAQTQRMTGALQDLMNQYTQGYGQLAKQSKKQYGKMMQTLKGVSSQREADIRRAYAERESDIMQNLSRLGMANTTVAPTMGMGVQREQEESLNRLADALLGTKLGIMGGRAGEQTRLGEAGLQGRLGIMQQLAALGARV